MLPAVTSIGRLMFDDVLEAGTEEQHIGVQQTQSIRQCTLLRTTSRLRHAANAACARWPAKNVTTECPPEVEQPKICSSWICARLVRCVPQHGF